MINREHPKQASLKVQVFLHKKFPFFFGKQDIYLLICKKEKKKTGKTAFYNWAQKTSRKIHEHPELPIPCMSSVNFLHSNVKDSLGAAMVALAGQTQHSFPPVFVKLRSLLSNWPFH